jgi:gallidermin-class lantibiotic protection ABC transporter ATP-binding subunit
MQMILETADLTRAFGRQRAVDRVDLAVPTGSIYGLLGPNGAGKSTLLKMLAGLLRPTSGEIRLFGQPWRRESLARVGALIETPALYGNLTGPENLEVHRRLLSLPPGRVGEVLRQVDLASVPEGKLASQYSLGMKQRLGIAVALLGEPDLLILDEPTNGLDPIGIQEMRDLIRSFQARAITVIIASHILSEVEQVVSHVGIIAGGRLRHQGPLDAGQDLEALFMETVSRKGGPA